MIAIRLEERDLVSTFGDRYIEYRERTPMLIPRLSLRREAGVSKRAVDG